MLRSRSLGGDKCACGVLLLGLMLPGGAVAQSTFGTILGTVKDNSGGVVQGAAVRLTNTDENTSREATTNGNGDYEFLNSLPAHYQVTVRNAGFETFTATSLLLVARQTLRVDATLQVGQASQSVVVQETEAGVI